MRSKCQRSAERPASCRGASSTSTVPQYSTVRYYCYHYYYQDTRIGTITERSSDHCRDPGTSWYESGMILSRERRREEDIFIYKSESGPTTCGGGPVCTHLRCLQPALDHKVGAVEAAARPVEQVCLHQVCDVFDCFRGGVDVELECDVAHFSGNDQREVQAPTTLNQTRHLQSTFIDFSAPGT